LRQKSGEIKQQIASSLFVIKIASPVPEMAVLQAAGDPQYLFIAVNQFLQANGQKARSCIRSKYNKSLRV
jgi:hypothetical protein